MSSNSGRSQLANQSRDIAGIFYDNPRQIYNLVNGFSTTAPLVEERQTWSTVNVTNAYGNTTRWLVDGRMDFSKEWYVTVTRTAGTHPVVTTHQNSPSFALDFEGYTMIDTYSIIYNNKVVYSKTGEQMKDDAREIYTPKELSAIGELVNGNLSQVQRQNRFALAQTMVIPLQMPWRLRENALFHRALPADIVLEVKWQTADRIFHQSIPAGTTVSGATTVLPTLSATCTLTLDTVHILEAARSAYFKTILDSPAPMWSLKTIEREYQMRDNPGAKTAGTANADDSRTIKIPNIRGNVFRLRVKLRYQQWVDNPRLLSDQLLPIRSIVLKDQNKEQTTVFSYVNNYNGSTGEPSLPIYIDNVCRFPKSPVGWFNHTIAFCPNEFVLASERNCFTMRTFNKFANPEIYVLYNTSLHTTCPVPDYSALQYPQTTTLDKTLVYFDVIADEHQIILQHKGDFRRLMRI